MSKGSISSVCGVLLLAPVVSHAGESPTSSEDGNAEFNAAIRRALTVQSVAPQNRDEKYALAHGFAAGADTAHSDSGTENDDDDDDDDSSTQANAIPDDVFAQAIRNALSGKPSDILTGPREEEGDYRKADATIKVAVYANGHWSGYSWLTLKEDGRPCAEVSDWLSWGVTSIVKFVHEDDTDNPHCMIPQRPPRKDVVEPADSDDDDSDPEAAHLHYDKLRQQLTVRIDESMMSRSRDTVPPWRLAYGMPAVRLGYQINGSQSTGNNYASAEHHATFYGGFDLGANFGPWRFRSEQNYSRETTGKPKWERVSTYIQRDIVPWRSKLLAGEGVTDSLLFDSMPFTGAQLMTEDNLLPDYLAAFTPVVRGVAKSTAEVFVRQHGIRFYQAVVAPGPFTLYDVRPPASSGDITVTVREADGTEHVSIVPYISMPLLVHKKVVKYALNVGRYRRASGSQGFTQPEFFQATAGIGLPYRISTFAGVLNARDYRSIAAGVGWDLAKAGSLSLDVTRSNVQDASLTDNPVGNRVRVRYAKSFASTGTGLNLDFRRYLGGHFRSLSDMLQRRADISYWRELLGDDGDDDGTIAKSMAPEVPPRTALRLDIQQNVGDTGNVYATLINNRFGGKRAGRGSLQVGGTWYGGHFDIDAQAGVSRTAKINSTTFQVSVSIPLSMGKRKQTLRYEASASRDDDGLKWGNKLSGSALRDYRLNYTLSQQQSKSAGAEGTASVSYQADAGRVDVSYGQGRDYRKIDMGIAGSVIGYKDGVVLGQSLGDTIAILDAPGFPDISVDGQLATRTDARGRAVVSYVTPYRINRLGLDSLDVGNDLDYHTLFREVAPVSGAILYVPIKPQPLIPVKTD
ncbi:fimbria/pilus outer membrane usher protein [Paraburkholderia bonniea]|uniref:fimbria/pilus outer membrane usher protein n=1 Tax=Paraburkholderia bonniea TaxID=2152891 RepID=UPI001291DAFB|nr:fimbria/pilus outer membrane usher protein [Paraburkholderia bonniea]